jgi:thioredoxin reductase (NADPH)
VLDNGKEIICSAVFIAIGEVPAVELAKKVGIMTDKDDFIIVDAEQATNIAGIFAAGDVTITPLRQIITAAADGAIAAMAAYKYLKSQKG